MPYNRLTTGKLLNSLNLSHHIRIVLGSSCVIGWWARRSKAMHDKGLAWCLASGRHPTASAVAIDATGEKRRLAWAARAGMESAQKS